MPDPTSSAAAEDGCQGTAGSSGRSVSAGPTRPRHAAFVCNLSFAVAFVTFTATSVLFDTTAFVDKMHELGPSGVLIVMLIRLLWIPPALVGHRIHSRRTYAVGVSAAEAAAIRRRAEQQARAERQHREAVRDVLRAGEQLEIHHQPIVDLATEKVLGYEALSRFPIEPRRPPNEWFALAFKLGLGVELELRAVVAALDTLSFLPEGTYLSINVSPATLAAPELTELLDGRGHSVVLEVTEHAAVGDYDGLLRAGAGIRATGARLAVDDAGAGYASFQHILRLAADIIKIDRDFTVGLAPDHPKANMIRALVMFATRENVTLVAEGIETAAQASILRSLGVQAGQGYHFGRPMPPACVAGRRAVH